MFSRKKLLNKKYIDVSILVIWYLVALSDIFSKTFSLTLQGIIMLYMVLPVLSKEKLRHPKTTIGGMILTGIAVVQNLMVK